MNHIFVTVLLLGMISPASAALTDISGAGSVIGGGGEVIGGGFETVNACGCNWSEADYVPEGMESTCINCSAIESEIGCVFDEICDDHKKGNAYGVIVGSTQKLTVECGTWIPPQKDPGSGDVWRTGYWSPLPSVSCDTVSTYRCGAGYYGKPTSETSGCNPCPNFDPNDTNPIISSENPRTSITSCYIMPNKTMSDSTGSYTYTDGCFYKN